MMQPDLIYFVFYLPPNKKLLGILNNPVLFPSSTISRNNFGDNGLDTVFGKEKNGILKLTYEGPKE